MKSLSPVDIIPWVKVSNYISVDVGASWGPRTIADFELVLVVSGRFVYEREGMDDIPLQTGFTLCIPPEELHALRRVDKAGRAVISCIHLELLPERICSRGDYRPDPWPPYVIDTRNYPEIRNLFRRSAEAFGGFGRYRAELVATIVREIWLRLNEIILAPDRPAYSWRMERMLEYLRDNLVRPVTRQDIGKKFSITPEHVNAIFKQELGMTPTQFLHRERISRAYRYLLEDGLSVKQASAKVGFDNPFYFSKIFKRITGTPPSEVMGKKYPPPILD